MACNSRCWNSRSRRCECSCMGKNHGMGKMTIDERLSFLRSAFPVCSPVRFKSPINGEIQYSTRVSFFESEGAICVELSGVPFFCYLSEVDILRKGGMFIEREEKHVCLRCGAKLTNPAVDTGFEEIWICEECDPEALREIEDMIEMWNRRHEKEMEPIALHL